MYIRVQQAIEPSDREEVFRFRYRVQAAELGLAPGDVDRLRGWIRDDQDEHARILVAVDDSSGAILGTLRALLGKDTPFSAELADSHDLSSMIVAFGDEQLCLSGMFMVDPAYRGQTVASQLVAGLVRTMLDEGVEIDVCRVEMAQARSWFQLGYRPYGPISQASERGELEVPLALVLRDRAYLGRTGSPLIHLLEPSAPDRAGMAQRLRELYPHFEDQLVTPQRLGAFWASVAHTTGSVRTASIFDGIDQHHLDPILRELPTVRLAADRPVPRDGEYEEGLGLILRGRLGLTMEEGERPFFASVLQPGEVFGALEGIPTSPPGARLLALEATELLILPDALLARLDLQAPETARRLRHNLGSILAGRLDATNRQVAGFMRGSPERIPVTHPDQGAASPHATRAEPSQDAGSSIEQIELDLLGRAGLPQAGTLLAPSSGDGQGTFLLARLHPQARVVGVEPDPERRATAEAQAQVLGLADHCTYLAGEAARSPLERGTVDGVYLRLALHRHADPLAVLREAGRVVRPGGRIAVLDIDDGGLLVHPEPPGFLQLQQRLDQIQRQLGGDRRVGRRLQDLLQQAGLGLLGCTVLPLSPSDLSLDQLVELVFQPRAQLLASAGVLDPRIEATLAELFALPTIPGAWLCAPVVLAWAEAPAPDLRF